MESQRHVSSAFRGEINKSVAMAENGRVIGRESWMRRNNKMVARRAHRDTRAVVSARAIAGGRCFLKAPLGIRAARTPVFLSPPSVLTRVRSRSGGEAPPKLDRRAGIILSSAESSSSLSSLANENNNLPIVLAAIRSSAVPFSRRREKAWRRRERSVRLFGILARSRSSIRFNLSLSFSLLPFPTFAKGLSAPITGTKYFEFIQQLFCLAVKLRHVRWNGRFERGRDTAGRMDSIHQSTDPPIFPQSDESRGLSTLDGTQGDQPSVHKPLPIGFRP